MTEHELDKLLQEYGGAVRAVCRAILPGHPQDAEEAEADTFYKLWRGAGLPADPAHRRRLVVLTARQCAIDRYRALLRRGETLPLDDRDDAELAVALCLVAAGAVVLGFFQPMSTANEATALVQKYGEVLEEPLTSSIAGHTVTVRALLRGQNTLRVLYDVDNAASMEPNDLVWDTSPFQIEAPKDSDPPNTLFSVYNANVGPYYGYTVGSWAERNKASETDTLSCFVDIPLANAKLTQRTLYICSLSDYSAHASVKISLPDAPAALTLPIQKTITLKGGPWFHSDLTDEEAAAHPDSSFDIDEIRIEPLSVSVIGKSHGSPAGGNSRYDVQSRVKLLRADGSELTYGWDGSFYAGDYGRIVNSAGLMTLRVDTYDLIDPAAIAYVEIDGERFAVE